MITIITKKISNEDRSTTTSACANVKANSHAQINDDANTNAIAYANTNANAY